MRAIYLLEVNTDLSAYADEKCVAFIIQSSVYLQHI
jgi:hypothetical protein